MGCPWFGGVPQSCEQRHPLEMWLDEAVAGEAVGVLRALDGVADVTVRPVEQIELGKIDGDVQEITVQRPNGWQSTAIASISTLREIASISRSEFPDRSEDDLFAAVRRVSAAGAVGCRLYVTRDAAVLARESVLGVSCMDPEHAAALVGLYLRSWQVTIVGRLDNVQLNSAPSTFCRLGANHLMPHFLPWVDTLHRGGPPPWFPVAPTVAERVKRALRARDGLQAAIQGDQNLETAEVALYNLDNFVLQLQGAADALALATTYAHSLPVTVSKVSWSSDPWRRAIRESVSQLAPAFDSGHAPALFRLISNVRNSIHDVAFIPVRARRRDQPRHNRTLVRLPGGNRGREIVDGARASGGLDYWGIDAGGLLLEPGTFVEAAICAITEILDRFMETDLTKGGLGNRQPAPVVAMPNFTEAQRRRVITLLGLPL